jgi:DNA polymerase I-like protein with 3'-5' exonuclease and polymerase domains
MSFGWGIENFYIPVRHEDSVLKGKQVEQLEMDWIREDVKAFFAQSDVWLIGHNCKFDCHFLENEGVVFNGKLNDTRILWHFFDENAPGAMKVIASGWTDHMGIKRPGIVDPTANADEKLIDEFRSNEARARRKAFNDAAASMASELALDPKYQGMKKLELKKLVKEQLLLGHPFKDAAKEDVHYGFVPIEDMTKYAALDTFLTWEIFHYCAKNVPWTKGLVELYKNEMELSTVLKDTLISLEKGLIRK